MSEHASSFRPERQIISKKGIPVEITGNPESECHSNKFSLGAGGMTKLETIHEPSREEENRLYREFKELEREFFDAQIARAEVTGSQDYTEHQKVMREERPELWRSMQEAERAMKKAIEKRYAFGNGGLSVSDVYVGKEGTLVYSLVSSRYAGEELKYVKEYRAWTPEVAGVLRSPSIEHQAEIDALRERILQTEYVADIHQVEVLPEFQGKGIAGSLLDVARWDIEQAKGIKFSIARVENNNPDRDKMLSLFIKAGYKVFYIEFDIEHYLVIREV
jgi:GNAT superfamily N-acetyltransferase